MVSKDRATVANFIRLLKLPKEMQKAVIDGKMTAGHARALLSIADLTAQTLLFVEIVHQGLSVREAEERAKNIGTGKKAAKKAKISLKDPEIAVLEEELRRILGTKVQILNKRGNKGKLVVEYYSLNDFDRILEVIRK
jgi:ParB family chromosome partitioning protein